MIIKSNFDNVFGSCVFIGTWPKKYHYSILKEEKFTHVYMYAY